VFGRGWHGPTIAGGRAGDRTPEAQARTQLR
jgi:hypothetical protein